MKPRLRWTSGWFLLRVALALVVAVTIFAIQRATLASASTFTVSSTADSGPGSLRQAILSANATAGLDVIKFAIPGAGPHWIQPATELPTITRPIKIDATTQPSYFLGLAPVVLDGRNTLDNGLVLDTGAQGSTIKGLALIQFNTASIHLAGSGGHRIQRNLFGTDGTTAYISGSAVVIDSSNNVIGGTVRGQGNVFAASFAGVWINGNGGSGNVVQGNRFGTNPAGNVQMGVNTGVYILDAPNNTVGGTAAGAGNLISGGATGVYVEGAGSTGNVIQGNWIGLDASGNGAIPNVTGVRLTSSSSGTLVGGTTASARNVISGNTSNGLRIDQNTTGNTVQGNYIGTNATGTAGLGNGEGIYIAANNNLIGGSAAGAGNLISNNGSGIRLEGDNNNIMGNTFGTDVTGTVNLGNFRAVTVIVGNGNVIGGLAAGEGNLFIFNTFGLEHDSGVATNTASGNCIAGNSTGAANASGTLIAEHNWWGVATGPNTFGGDTTIGTIDTNPWLTEAPGFCGGNWIANSHFEDDADATPNLPDSWLKNSKVILDPAKDFRDTTVFNNGVASWRFVGNGTGKVLTQDIAITGYGGDQFDLSVWTQHQGATGSGVYRVRMIFFYNNGTAQGFVLNLTGDPALTWTQHALSITAGSAYHKVQMRLEYAKGGGTVWFDDISLIRN